MTILVSLYLEGTILVVGDYNRETHTQIRITNLCLFPVNVDFFLQATKSVNWSFMSLYSEGRIFKVKLKFRKEWKSYIWRSLWWGGLFLGLWQLLIGATEFFDFVFVIIDLMARFYRDSFNSDRNASDKLFQNSSLKSLKSFFNPGKGVFFLCFMFLSRIF